MSPKHRPSSSESKLIWQDFEGGSQFAPWLGLLSVWSVTYSPHFSPHVCIGFLLVLRFSPNPPPKKKAVGRLMMLNVCMHDVRHQIQGVSQSCVPLIVSGATSTLTRINQLIKINKCFSTVTHRLSGTVSKYFYSTDSITMFKKKRMHTTTRLKAHC